MSTTTAVALTPTQFRADFRSFADRDKYDDNVVQLYLNLAFASLNPNIWQQFYVMGMELFAAHHLVIDAKDQAIEQAGGTAGNATGQISSKGVGGASLSFNAGMTAEQGAGFWNLTTFGTRFYRLMRMVGMGGTQLGGDPNAINAGVMEAGQGASGPPWPGPFGYNIPNA